jgi:hypothetical protein
MWSPHKHKKILYCIHKTKQDYEHTSYPAHLKLTVKNKVHASAEQLIPHGQCVVAYRSGLFGVQTLTTLHACASSMMDGGAANFGAVQYPGRYSNFTLDDKLLNLMDKLNYAVALIVHPCHPKGKTLCWTGHLKLNNAPAPAGNLRFKSQILRSGRMWSQNIEMYHLWI